MKKLCAALILALCLSLGGCSLLRGDPASVPDSDDRLVGVYITSEYLDLFDIEGYLNGSMDSLGGGEISAADAARYSGRVYAEVTDGEAVFPFEGEALISARFGSDGSSYIGSQRGPHLTGGSTNVIHSDDMDAIELSATIYAPTGEYIAAYCNPVYQEPDGSIYLISGQGLSTEGTGKMTQTIEHSTSARGGEPGSGMTIELSIEARRLSEKYAVLLYGADGALISREEYAPGALPAELSSGGAAYAVIEDYSRDADGEAAVERVLLTPGGGEEFLSFTHEAGETWLTPHSTRLK